MKSHSLPHRFVFLLLASLTLSTVLHAKEVEFFVTEETIHIRLEAPIAKLKKQRGDNPEWLQGQVLYTDAQSEVQTFDVKIKARGNFRRKRSSCSFPAYWLNFKKSQIKGTDFKNLDKVKIVAHCRETRKSFEPYIYKEFLAYKTYNLLTDKSFRVRLANIEYYDSEKEKELKSFAAFFIEHVESFEDRLKAKQVKDRYIPPSLFDLEDLCLAELFQYMVGNSDFSFFASTDECCHNAKVFSMKDPSEPLMPVPYDFDMTGLVNPPYATVNPKMPISSVTERYYRGMRVPPEVFDKVIQRYQDKREEIMDLWENADFLPDKEKAEAMSYLDEFYAVLDNPDELKRQIKSKMRSIDKLDELLESRIDGLEVEESN